MKKATLTLQDVRLFRNEIASFRGCVGNYFPEYDLIHNHRPDGRNIYRYPLIQFKVIDQIPVMIAVTDEAVKIFVDVFLKLENLNIGGRNIPVHEKDIMLEEVEVGYTDELITYEFTSSWIALNQKKHQEYQQADEETKQQILKSCLTGNILAFAKGLGIWLSEDQRLKVDVNVQSRIIKLKGTTLLGFNGVFKVNFLIPDFLAIGKSVSRGFGTVVMIS